MGKAALEAGKHIRLEKPLAASSEECIDLGQIAKKNRLILMAKDMFSISPVVGRIKQIVDKGDIGDIREHRRVD